MRVSVVQNAIECGKALIDWLHTDEDTAMFNFANGDKKDRGLFIRMPDQFEKDPYTAKIVYMPLGESSYHMDAYDLGIWDKKSGYLILRGNGYRFIPSGYNTLLSHPQIVAYQGLMNKVRAMALQRLFMLCRAKYPNRESLPPYKAEQIKQSTLDSAWLEGNLNAPFQKVFDYYLKHFLLFDLSCPHFLAHLRGDSDKALADYGVPYLFNLPEEKLSGGGRYIKKAFEKTMLQSYHWLGKAKKYKPSHEAIAARNIYEALKSLAFPANLTMHAHVNSRPVAVNIPVDTSDLKPRLWLTISSYRLDHPVYTDTNTPCALGDFAQIKSSEIDSIYDAEGKLIYKKQSE